MEETIIIGELQVWPKDLGKMEWDKAKVEVAKLGPGWRLPTIEEFKEILYPSRSGILGLDVTDEYYWSSTETANNTAWYFTWNSVYANYTYKYYTYYVRPVRDFTGESALGILLKDF